MEIPDSDDDEEEAQFFPEAPQNDQHHKQDKSMSPAQFIDRVLSQLNTTITTQQHQHQHPGQNQNPFSTLSPSELSRAKPLMLTLHCLFPNELLLALDILDRGLVRRLVNEDEDEDHNGHSFSFPPPSSLSSSPIEKSKPVEAIFLVISTSNSSTTTTREEEKGYEVRLQAWNCSCPSFTISAFRDPEESGPELDPDTVDVGVDVDIPVEQPSSSTSSATTTEAYRFGGTLTRGFTRSSAPVCKHLLACVLLVRCPRLFGTGTGPHSRLVVSAKELAGWCAGWGG